MEGSELGAYQLIARLGMGGMAEVYLARRSGPAGFTKYVAIKRMRSDLTEHQEFVDLFAEEAKTASLLSHPNICQVHEFNASEGEYYMVMEYLEGVSVASIMIRALRRRGWPPLSIIAGIMEQACDGIHYAHEISDEAGNHLRIVHRDISPPNLLVTTNGVVKLLDFGISKSRQSVVQTMTGQIRGKFSYMSPEQLQSKTLDRRSDIFSLGIVAHELICGRRLFRRATRLQVYHAITSEDVPPLSTFRADVPPTLEAVVRRALARDRDDRFDTARDFADALRRCADDFDGVADSKVLGEFVAEYFDAELESKRQLFTSPRAPTSDLMTGDSVDAPGGVIADPTVNLRGPEDTGVTEPDATVPGFVSTSVNTVTAESLDDEVTAGASDAVATGSVDEPLSGASDATTTGPVPAPKSAAADQTAIDLPADGTDDAR